MGRQRGKGEGERKKLKRKTMLGFTHTRGTVKILIKYCSCIISRWIECDFIEGTVLGDPAVTPNDAGPPNPW